MSDDNFISRWSRRKTASKAPSAAGTAGPTVNGVPAPAGTRTPTPPGNAVPAAPEEPPKPLPPIESLTPESDFAAFMKPDVDPGLKRQAFKKLIEDPKFNVMDGLDVYIDDYSKPDPLPEGWLEKMNQVKRLGLFKEAQEAPGEAEEARTQDVTEPSEALQKTISDQGVEELPPSAAPRAPEEGIPRPEVGKSEVSRGGS